MDEDACYAKFLAVLHPNGELDVAPGWPRAFDLADQNRLAIASGVGLVTSGFVFQPMGLAVSTA